MLSQTRLIELLAYDAGTGVFTWQVNRGSVKKGAVAGKKNANGYTYIKVDGSWHLAHRLAWLYTQGCFPSGQVDHVNNARSDNRLANLRVVSQKQNSENRTLNANNTSGAQGVSFHKKAKKFVARVKHNNSTRYIGLFDTVAAAANAAQLLRNQLFTHHKTV
jgi:hypothetical protein